MILLWDFHDTSCKFIRKVSFLYITIYQVNTTLFSLKMRLWDFFHKKTITHKNGITVILAIVLEWNTNKEDGDCKSPGESGRTFFDSGLQIRWNAWRETFWLRISQNAWRETYWLKISQNAWRETFWLYAKPITQHQKEPFFDLNQLLQRFNQNNWNLFLVFIYFLYLCPRIPIKKGRIPIKEDKTTYKTCNLNNV